ncbi:MAG: hypothetical protein J7521_20215 [Caulobacter sp.]|nr:hypothetical protein [Caulobacter sp.]
MTSTDQNGELLNDVVHEHVGASRAIAGELCWLADAFSATGNQAVADRLVNIAQHVEALSKRLRDAFSADLNERLRESEQATMNMISGVLAGMNIGARSKQEGASA